MIAGTPPSVEHSFNITKIFHLRALVIVRVVMVVIGGQAIAIVFNVIVKENINSWLEFALYRKITRLTST